MTAVKAPVRAAVGATVGHQHRQLALKVEHFRLLFAQGLLSQLREVANDFAATTDKLASPGLERGLLPVSDGRSPGGSIVGS